MEGVLALFEGIQINTVFTIFGITFPLLFSIIVYIQYRDISRRIKEIDRRLESELLNQTLTRLDRQSRNLERQTFESIEILSRLRALETLEQQNGIDGLLSSDESAYYERLEPQFNNSDDIPIEVQKMLRELRRSSELESVIGFFGSLASIISLALQLREQKGVSNEEAIEIAMSRLDIPKEERQDFAETGIIIIEDELLTALIDEVDVSVKDYLDRLKAANNAGERAAIDAKAEKDICEWLSRIMYRNKDKLPDIQRLKNWWESFRCVYPYA